jgi:hypothetical protein
MAVKTESGCKSIFVSDQGKVRETFTKLWTQIINEKESGRDVRWGKEM